MLDDQPSFFFLPLRGPSRNWPLFCCTDDLEREHVLPTTYRTKGQPAQNPGLPSWSPCAVGLKLASGFGVGIPLLEEFYIIGHVRVLFFAGDHELVRLNHDADSKASSYIER